MTLVGSTLMLRRSLAARRTMYEHNILCISSLLPMAIYVVYSIPQGIVRSSQVGFFVVYILPNSGVYCSTSSHKRRNHSPYLTLGHIDKYHFTKTQLPSCSRSSSVSHPLPSYIPANLSSSFLNFSTEIISRCLYWNSHFNFLPQENHLEYIASS